MKISIYCTTQDSEAAQENLAALIDLLTRNDHDVWVSWKPCTPGEVTKTAISNSLNADFIVVYMTMNMFADSFYHESICPLVIKEERPSILIHSRAAVYAEDEKKKLFPEKAIGSYENADEKWAEVGYEVLSRIA